MRAAGRAIGGEETTLGADYDFGARARQIRDDLFALRRAATPADMLAIQLDSRALFLARWRDLLVALIDEDAMQDAQLRREFRRIQRELRQTALIVTHDIAEAFELGSRVGVIDEGRLVVCDTPAAVARSTDSRVREFLDAVPSALPA